MRKIIAWEGSEKVPNQLLEIGAMQFPKSESVLVEESNHPSRPPIGKATDFRREEDGSVTAEITFFDPANEDLLKVCAVTVYGLRVEGGFEQRDPLPALWRISKFDLVAVYLTDQVPWRVRKELGFDVA